MLEWVTVASARIAAGNEFVLARHDQNWVVRVDGRMLMSSKMHQSEIALAELAFDAVPDAESVLVGGLGLGYTLRAVLDGAGPRARVTVAELVPELVEWNRTHLAPLHDHALEDPRVDVALGDVHETLRRSRGAFDAILLDVDNGPMALSQARNQRLYNESGVRFCFEALRPGACSRCGRSGTRRSTKEAPRRGFHVEAKAVSARTGSRAKHVVFVATR
ncbi:MAG: hypothetical protein U0414_30890 [Polyangiaceae bacterium]